MQGLKDGFDSLPSNYLAMSEALLTMNTSDAREQRANEEIDEQIAYESKRFKINSIVQHKEQDIKGLVLWSDDKETTIYDEACPNDDDFPEESEGHGSNLTFKNYELELIS